MALMIDNGIHANFWKLAIRPGFEDTQASTALYWDAINIASAKKLRTIDTGPAPSRGIAEYKRQWGAAEIPYYSLRIINMPLYQAIEQIRKVLRMAERLGLGGKPEVSQMGIKDNRAVL
jgi:hypothetical protein